MDFYVVAIVFLAILITALIIYLVREAKYKQLEAEALKSLGFSNWNFVSHTDERVVVKSRQTLEKYDDIRFFKENPERFPQAKRTLEWKQKTAAILRRFLGNNPYKGRWQYGRLENKIKILIGYAEAYRISVNYISKAGNHLGERIIVVSHSRMRDFVNDPSLLMGRGEYSKYIKEKQKEELDQKHRKYYQRVDKIIEFANESRELLLKKESQEQLDNLSNQLFDRTVNSIKKIKDSDSVEWVMIESFISRVEGEIKSIVEHNAKILAYYESPDFQKVKTACETLMSTQREFNNYIIEKVESISSLFGTRIVREETVNADEYQYVRPYKKTISPFAAEVSAAVFASAENNPLGYVVKNFYPNKAMYPEQIQKLHLLIEELETLKEAKLIIENYKEEYQQYLGDVPKFIMEEDETGFYSRLGFANIDENVLSVEYTFSYTSGGGMAKRAFAVPMTEETIVELIKTLEGKLTVGAFTKEQRALMTSKMREHIKARDNYTCCKCGNSTHAEPNLLLEIDHIIPVSKGGYTVEENLQTLCWKCNREKGSKLMLK